MDQYFEISKDQIITDAHSFAEIIMNARFNGITNIIVKEEQLDPQFWDLKSGLAGEILQQASTYDAKLAIIGDFSKYKSNALQSFITESNKIGRVNFVSTLDQAKQCF